MEDKKPFYPCVPEEVADYIQRAFAGGDAKKALDYMERQVDLKRFLPGPYLDSWLAATKILKSRTEYF